MMRKSVNLCGKYFHTSSQLSLFGDKLDSNGKYAKYDYNFPPGKPNDKPKEEHFYFIRDNLLVHTPNFFKEGHPFFLYTPEVVFENNFFDKPRVYKGIVSYAIQMSLVKIRANYKYGFIRTDIVAIDIDKDDSTIEFHWKVTGISGADPMVQPWRFQLWKVRESMRKEAEVFEGLSRFFIRGDGRIYKHRLDRTMLQKRMDENTNPLLSKLGNFDMSKAM